MNSNLSNALALGMMFLALFAAAEALYWKHNVKVELTRKFVHMASGLISLSFPLLITNHWIVLALCASFASVLIFSYRKRFLLSINAVDRVTHGSLLFPLVVYLCYFAFSQSGLYVYYYLPILILAISDPLAALAGKSIPMGPYMVFGQSKTLMGSGAFFLSAFACSFMALWRMEATSLPFAFLAALIISATTAGVEAVTHKGYDNLLIPVSCIASILLTQYLQLF